MADPERSIPAQDVRRKIANQCPPFLLEPKEEPIDAVQVIPDDNQVHSLDFTKDGMVFKDEDMKFELDDASFKVEDSFNGLLSNRTGLTPFFEKAELDFKNEEIPDKDKPFDKMLHDVVSDDMIGAEEEDEDQCNVDQQEFCDRVQVEKRRRSSRNIAGEISDHLDSGDMGQSTKKSRWKPAKKNDTELECPQCEYRTKSVSAWMSHLAYTHSTTPTEAGIALLCACGAKCFSNGHTFTCKIANYTVIPMRRSINKQHMPPGSIWTYFTKSEVYQDTRGFCSLCNWSKKIGLSTIRMSYHLKAHHPIEHSILKQQQSHTETQGQYDRGGSTVGVVPGHIPPSNLTLPGYPEDSEEDEEVKEELNEEVEEELKEENVH